MGVCHQFWMEKDGEQTDEDNDTGKKPDTDVTDAEKTISELDKLKAANDEVEKELLRKEELRAKVALGGQSEAGQEKPKPKEVSDEEYAKKALSGELNE